MITPMASADAPDAPGILQGLRIAFVGKLGGTSKREAQGLVREQGGIPVDDPSADIDLVVLGADELPLDEEQLLEERLRLRAAEGRLEILSETQFWQRLGLMEEEADVRLYTPAMLAELLSVPVAIIRRWHRRKLIIPVREVRRLPYFDFQEVATARQLAALLAAGASPDAIERKLASLARYVPDVDRPLAQLSVIVQGQYLLLRQGEGLVEPGGQLRIDFDALEEPEPPALEIPAPPETLPLPTDNMLSSDTGELLELADRMEDEGQLEQATEFYRAALAAGGPVPETCFRLAELLYRQGEVGAARERYYMAIELDEDYVEARANLGCVLAETGQLELAAAAFEGALRYHEDYPDAHYHLARTLDELGQYERAGEHWRQFLVLVPTGPWAEEARRRLGWGAVDS
jgi:tetratricopeptide (TPR) repeat protein